MSFHLYLVAYAFIIFLGFSTGVSKVLENIVQRVHLMHKRMPDSYELIKYVQNREKQQQNEQTSK